MALGTRQPKQTELFVSADQIRKGSGQPFYNQLIQVLEEGGFDPFLEELCAPHYKRGGRPGIPPGAYFGMLFIGFFEGLDSQRSIAWRCANSLALRDFLGCTITEATPVHASMTSIRQRLPQNVLDEVFTFVLRRLQEADLLHGKAFGIDATTLEANAANGSNGPSPKCMTPAAPGEPIQEDRTMSPRSTRLNARVTIWDCCCAASSDCANPATQTRAGGRWGKTVQIQSWWSKPWAGGVVT